MTDLVHRCKTKAMVAEGDQTMASWRWAVSRRGTLKVFADRLECGDWSIPYTDIEESILRSGAGLLFPGYVLQVRTKDKTYQFGLNPMPFWKGDLPFSVRRARRSPGRTRTVFAVRAIALAALVYWLWTQYGK